MATSGTISTTVFNTRRVIDSAYRGCRLSPQVVTGEMIETAKEQLFLLLSALVNAGAPLWCNTKYILPMYLGVPAVPCPAGTYDVREAQLRTLARLEGTASASEGDADNAFDSDLTTACVQTIAAGYIQLELETAAGVSTIGILPGATGAWDITVQYSNDGTTWVDYLDLPEFAAVDGVWQWFDVESGVLASYWRLQANGATILDVAELDFANTPQEIPVARINVDDYWNLPNKTFQGRPVQYWLDRQRDVPIMRLWPAPNAAAQFQQITILAQRHIMDVGTLQQELEVPQRWYQAIVAGLAKELAMITPEVKLDMIPVTQKDAADKMRLAWAEETDSSPMYLAPDLSIYTR